MTSSQISSSDDDVRRSLDVLDQVLSEFDDIEDPLCLGSEDPLPSPGCRPQEEEAVEELPPPVDRSLKPPFSKSPPAAAPSLPQKTRKKEGSESPDEGGVGGKVVVGEARCAKRAPLPASQRSRLSEASSHEYQEINSDFCAERDPFGVGQRGRVRHTSHRESVGCLDGGPERRAYNRRGGRDDEEPRVLRKSRSQDIPLATRGGEDGLPRGRRSGRHTPPGRRGRSSERFLERPPAMDQGNNGGPMFPDFMGRPPMDPRLMFAPEFGGPVIDPRLLPPEIGPMSDPRFWDPTKFQGHDRRRYLMEQPPLPHVDPRVFLMDRPVLMDDPRASFDGQYPHPMDDPMLHPFPHLMPPHNSMMDFHPHTIPPFDYPILPDPLLDFPPYPLHGFDPRLKPIDPSASLPPPAPPPMRNRGSFAPAVDYPMEIPPFSYPPEFHPPPVNFAPPRETLAPHPSDPRLQGQMSWLPPSPDQARKTIQRIVRNQNLQEFQNGGHKELRDSSAKENNHSKGDSRRRSKSTSNSDSSGRSSPGHDSRSRRGSQGQKSNGQTPTSPQGSGVPGLFRVGEAVRKDGQSHREFGGKDTISLPHFVSGGKDSGFDESPVVDETTTTSLNDKNNRGGTPSGVGGGFVVAGVFSDSSKMYIPAPPSPTPDYDNEHPASDGEDSDIPQEPFYVSSKKKKVNGSNEKTSMSSNRGSLSEDSLQEGTPNTGLKGNSLQSMIEEFQMGLPPPKPIGREDSRFSEDSLEEEEENASKPLPSRPSTGFLEGQRPESLESLVSMDGSTTSFDYVTDPSRKNSNNTSKTPISPKGNCPPKINPRIQSNRTEKPQDKTSSKSKNLNFERKKKEAPKPNKAGSKQSNIRESLLPRQLSSGSSEDSKKEVPKFDTIRHLMKEGLIEGLDDTPPDFAPPPPPPHKFGRSSSASEERTDSGLGSTASTNNRTDESGGSDNQSDKITNTPPKKLLSENRSLDCIMNIKTPSPPPLPPPRDSSISSSGSSNNHQVTRNQSWLFKERADNEQYHSNQNANKMAGISSNQPRQPKLKTKKEKITHIDDLRNDINMKNGVRCSRVNDNDNLASQYATPSDNKGNELNRNTFLENTKNLQGNIRCRDSCSSMGDDQGSLSSHSSRSSRFFSRLTESMKSNSRSNSPIVNKNNAKKVGTKYHVDVIRAPSHMKKQAPKPPLGVRPPEFKSVTDPTSLIPLTRDGSGRFRSIEDLAEIASSGGKSLELKRADDEAKKKKKKNSTLPPNLNSSDLMEQERDLKRISSNMKDSQNRDDTEGSKFKFNIFKGFWRRNKYSFDKM